MPLPLLPLLPLLACLAAAPAEPDAAARERGRLQGAWRLVEVKTNAGLEVAERRGGEWVAGAGLEAARVVRVTGVAVVFDGDRVAVRRGRRATRLGELEFPAGVFRVDPSASPRGLDVTPAGGRPAVRACYLLDADELWVADHGPGGDRPADFSMGVGMATEKRIFVLRRERPAK